jgi:hypothetical protein
MVMEGLFDLQTPTDLLRKLEREYERWKADPLNTDPAWNFFVTAEHPPDGWRGQEAPDYRQASPTANSSERNPSCASARTWRSVESIWRITMPIRTGPIRTPARIHSLTRYRS